MDRGDQMNQGQRVIIALTLGLLALVSAGFDIYNPMMAKQTVARVYQTVAEFFISEFLFIVFLGMAFFIIAGFKKRKK